MTDDVLIIQKKEHHLWKTCPCDVCVREREKRVPPDSSRRLRHLSILNAYSLGIVSKTQKFFSPRHGRPVEAQELVKDM